MMRVTLSEEEEEEESKSVALAMTGSRYARSIEN